MRRGGIVVAKRSGAMQRRPRFVRLWESCECGAFLFFGGVVGVSEGWAGRSLSL